MAHAVRVHVILALRMVRCEDPKGWDYPQLYVEFKVSLGYMKPHHLLPQKFLLELSI